MYIKKLLRNFLRSLFVCQKFGSHAGIVAGVARQTQIEDQAHDEHARDHIAREDVADEARQLVEKAVGLRDADAEADGGCAMSVLRWSMPASCIMRTPDIIIEPNMMTVQPPSTQSGGVVKNAPKGGNRPPRIIASAPNMIVKRLTTWVIEMRPTFWLNDVMGEQPNTPPESAAASVMVATRRFCHEPSGYADEEPNDETPTFRMLRPIDGGDDLAPVLGRQAQHAFKAAADDDRADHDAVILRGRRKTGGEEREADAHDDRQT